MMFLLMMNYRTETKRNRDHLLGRKGSIKTNSTQNKSLGTKVAIPMELLPEIFSPAKLHLEKEGKRIHTTLAFTGPHRQRSGRLTR